MSLDPPFDKSTAPEFNTALGGPIVFDAAHSESVGASVSADPIGSLFLELVSQGQHSS